MAATKKHYWAMVGLCPEAATLHGQPRRLPARLEAAARAPAALTRRAQSSACLSPAGEGGRVHRNASSSSETPIPLRTSSSRSLFIALMAALVRLVTLILRGRLFNWTSAPP